ncbi:hypothetical protein [Actinocorallia longicatena]|uniref:ATP-grasp domain-containing protein n=1 Tax=Actinocorallia longicatena TaxID=111803 RepID=A0ABP6QCU2_9ACTN
MSPRSFVPLLEEAAGRVEVKVEWLSDHWIGCLTRAGSVQYVHGTQFPLNLASAAFAAHDKVSTSTILSDGGIPAVAHLLVRFRSRRVVEHVIDPLLPGLRFPVVVKPLSASGGSDVVLARSVTELREALVSLAPRHAALAVSPFERIDAEYRVVVLDRAPLLCFRKDPAPGEWRHNLGRGARPTLVEDDLLRARLEELAVGALDRIGGRFMAVDIVRVPEGLKVLEINSGVALGRFSRQGPEYRELGLGVYERAVRVMFGRGVRPVR